MKMGNWSSLVDFWADLVELMKPTIGTGDRNVLGDPFLLSSPKITVTVPCVANEGPCRYLVQGPVA